MLSADLGSNVESFLNAAGEFFNHLSDIDWVPFAFALGFLAAMQLARAWAWRNVLHAAYPKAPISFLPLSAAYLAGAGINAVVPAHAGDVTKVFLVKRQIPGSSYPAVTSSFLVGVTFAAGWSPSVGPILGAILIMAADQGSIDRAVLLLATYSPGLAVQFLLAAVTLGLAPSIIRGINRRFLLVTGVSGGLMVAMGAIMTLGIYQQFFARLVALSPWTPWEPAL